MNKITETGTHIVLRLLLADKIHIGQIAGRHHDLWLKAKSPRYDPDRIRESGSDVVKRIEAERAGCYGSYIA